MPSSKFPPTLRMVRRRSVGAKSSSRFAPNLRFRHHGPSAEPKRLTLLRSLNADERLFDASLPCDGKSLFRGTDLSNHRWTCCAASAAWEWSSAVRAAAGSIINLELGLSSTGAAGSPSTIAWRPAFAPRNLWDEFKTG